MWSSETSSALCIIVRCAVRGKCHQSSAVSAGSHLSGSSKISCERCVVLRLIIIACPKLNRALRPNISRTFSMKPRKFSRTRTLLLNQNDVSIAYLSYYNFENAYDHNPSQIFLNIFNRIVTFVQMYVLCLFFEFHLLFHLFIFYFLFVYIIEVFLPHMVFFNHFFSQG